jgi:TetR/AcrR family transcriptional repressor of nem operon
MRVTKGQRTKREIVEKAAPLFNKKGFEGTSLSDLMHATGLQKGGIYRHFSSKEQLATAAFDYSWGKAVQERLGGVAGVPDCVNRLKLMIDNFVQLRSGLVPGGCPLMNTAVESDDGNAWTRRLSEITIEGIKKHQIDPRVDPLKLSHQIIASLEGALLINRLRDDNETLEDMRKQLHSYLEQNVRAKTITSKRVKAS